MGHGEQIVFVCIIDSLSSAYRRSHRKIDEYKSAALAAMSSWYHLPVARLMAMRVASWWKYYPRIVIAVNEGRKGGKYIR
jgi:hypothetical protein